MAKNPHAVALGKKRWANIPKQERTTNGGAPRKYIPCTKYRAHVFSKAGVCYGCGLKQTDLKAVLPNQK